MRLTKSFKYYLLRIIKLLYLFEALRVRRISSLRAITILILIIILIVRFIIYIRLRIISTSILFLSIKRSSYILS